MSARVSVDHSSFTYAPMEPLLRLVNRLQETCALAGDVSDVGSASAATKQQKLPSLWETLPQIVVVGGQSSGKSSVLESIVGLDFLPRGSGICTRRPLVLQLHCSEPGETASARFLHKPGKVFTDFSEVRKEIDAETDRSLTTKGPKAVSADPIMLSIKSPNAPSLTLVDMPGLTKVATKDQPASTVSEIETMAKKFIASPNVVIVAVSAANADIATSDGIRVAKDADPNFERTLGILTKIDLMDKGTDAVEVLSGKALHLKLGWCAVVNRSQSDIQSGVDMPSARDAERKWFSDHAHVYGDMIDKTGTDTLVQTLTSILETQVRLKIPRIQETVAKSARGLELELSKLGRHLPAFEDRGALVHEVLRGCDMYEKQFVNTLDCQRNYTNSTGGGGEVIRKLFEEGLPQNLKQVDLNSFYSSKRVKAIVDASDGYQPHLVAPEMGIRKLIELGLNPLHEPVEMCVDQVDRVLRQAMQQSAKIIVGGSLGNQSGNDSTLLRFPALRDVITTAAQKTLHELKKETLEMTNAMVDMEASYFDADFFREIQAREQLREERSSAERLKNNSSTGSLESFPVDDTGRNSLLDADLAGGQRNGNAGGASFAQRVTNTFTGGAGDKSTKEEVSRDDARLQFIASSVRAYVEAVRGRLAKTVPKAIVHKLVLRARKGILRDFCATVGRTPDEELKTWMREDPGVKQRREVLSKRLTLLDKARDEIALVVGEYTT